MISEYCLLPFPPPLDFASVLRTRKTNNFWAAVLSNRHRLHLPLTIILYLAECKEHYWSKSHRCGKLHTESFCLPFFVSCYKIIIIITLKVRERQWPYRFLSFPLCVMMYFCGIFPVFSIQIKLWFFCFVLLETLLKPSIFYPREMIISVRRLWLTHFDKWNLSLSEDHVSALKYCTSCQETVFSLPVL